MKRFTFTQCGRNCKGFGWLGRLPYIIAALLGALLALLFVPVYVWIVLISIALVLLIVLFLYSS